jgi:hypothetical protein
VRMEGGWKVEENNLEGDERNGRAEYRACCIMEEDEKEEEKRRNKEERTPSHDLAINTTGNKMCVRSVSAKNVCGSRWSRYQIQIGVLEPHILGNSE